MLTWLDRIWALPVRAPVVVLHVCGEHERTIARSGLREALPDHVTLLPGPGCPVCVTPDADVRFAIRLALEGAIVAVAGDLARVPTDARTPPRSLEAARAAGADVRSLARPDEAIRLARAEPTRDVVLFAAGFEPQMVQVAGLVRRGLPDNLTLHLVGRRTWPVVRHLLEASDLDFDAVVAPGHVATVMGPEEWEFVVDCGIPTTVAGFAPEAFLEALYRVLRQLDVHDSRLDNAAPDIVRPGGNPGARRLLEEVFEVGPADWRGIGRLPDSGFALRGDLAHHDARLVWGELATESRRGSLDMPGGCPCAEVLAARRSPDACPLYGTRCTPATPVGPCMVGHEGACRIRWAARRRVA